MKMLLAILGGSLIIGIAIVGTQFVPHYQIAPIATAEGTYAAWRINTVSGIVDMCRPSTDPLDVLSNNGATTYLYLSCSPSLPTKVQVLPPKSP